MKVSKEFAVGALVLVGGIVFYLGFGILKGDGAFSNNKTYYAVYDNIEGLAISSPIFVNGKRVGKVDQTRLMTDQSNQILVSMLIEGSVEIGKNSQALLFSVDPISGKSIKLELEPSPKQYLEDGDTMMTTVEEGIVQKIQKQAQPVINKLNTILSQLKDVVDTTGETSSLLMETLRHVKATSENTAAMSKQLAFIMQKNTQNINEIVSNLKLMTNNFVDISDSTKVVMAEFATVSKKINAMPLPSIAAHLDSITSSLKTATASLSRGDNTAGALLTEKELYENLDNAVKNMNYLMVDIQANPKRYINFSVFGGKTDAEKPLIKKIVPKSPSNTFTIELKRTAPAGLKIQLFHVKTREQIDLEENKDFAVDGGAEAIEVTLPSDIPRGEYNMRVSWAGNSSGEVETFTIQ